MKEQLIQILSSVIDKRIVVDLIDSYESIKKSFINSNFEETQSKSGKFVENIFRTLEFIRTKQFLSEIKQSEFTKISEKLINSDGSKYPESIRILIPEIAQSLIYLPRSKLGSVHVKPIKPDYIDAKLTVEACNWIIAELIRQYHDRNPESVTNLIKNLVKEEIPIIQKIGEEIFINAKIKANEEILIRLFDSQQGLTREQLGNSMKSHFSPAAITLALQKLHSDRKIHITKDNLYILSDSERNSIGTLITSLSNKD